MIIFGKERGYVVHDEYQVKGFFGNYRFLSNYELGSVLYDGIIYPSSENAYQAAKSFDIEIRKKFINVSPNESKKMAKTILIREDWEEVKYGIMYNIVLDKFIRNRELGDKLIETGDKYLEETNHWKDITWVVCDGVGKNWLGKILMDVRTDIK
jgi:ribA/ribD-fused uncharacterized protein